jgi:hypothetical protein
LTRNSFSGDAVRRIWLSKKRAPIARRPMVEV